VQIRLQRPMTWVSMYGDCHWVPTLFLVTRFVMTEFLYVSSVQDDLVGRWLISCVQLFRGLTTGVCTSWFFIFCRLGQQACTQTIYCTARLLFGVRMLTLSEGWTRCELLCVTL